MENYRTNLSLSQNMNQDLSSWIEEQQYIEMLVQNFPNNPDICGYLGNFMELYSNVWLFSNLRDKILIVVEIL